MVLAPSLILLGVPSAALAAFVVLGLDPFTLSRRQVHWLALIGAIVPMLIMLPLTLSCAAGYCIGEVPIFTLVVGQSEVALALALDPLSALFGMTVTTIGALVMIYSVGYMAGTVLSDLRRYFALMNLFIAAMLTMVLAGDSIVLFLGWELMGLCSFFLIAYNTASAQAITAGRKAFIMTRVADALLLAALLLLFLEAGSVRLETLIPAGVGMDENRRMIIAWLLLGGALGKSAQVPFHTWLPSAMAGPTPVSTLLHSATMVAAGAFLLMRFAPIMATEPGVQAVAAILGVGTALFGAMAAMFQQDVKRLLAYSSISQIGFMMLAIGVGAPEAAAAHFVVHAIFKSLLFLGAGDITHGSPWDTDIVAMRGAWGRRPLAYLCFIAGAASLAGLPMITAGWWSKEAVLAAVYGSEVMGRLLWTLALVSATLTGAYAFRPVLIGLKPEAAPPPESAHPHKPGRDVHGHKRSKFGSLFIRYPLSLLASGALLAGVLVGPIIRFLGGQVPHAPAFTEHAASYAPFIGFLIAASLAFVPALSRSIQRVRQLSRGPQGGRYRGESRFVRFAFWLSRGARVDHLYQVVFVWPFVHLVRWLNGYRGGIADPVGSLPVLAAIRLQQTITAPLAADGFDRLWHRFADGVVRICGGARRVQTGRARDYALAMALGAAALLMLAWGTS